MRKYRYFVLAVLATFITITGCQGATSSPPTVAGMDVPDFTLPDLKGNAFQLASVKGDVIILDFWATWCPPCRAEIPHFQELHETYAASGLSVIGVALDQGGVKEVKPFVESQGVTYQIVIGNSTVTDSYGGIRGIPTTFVIDREGKVIEKFVGYRDKETFENLIKALL